MTNPAFSWNQRYQSETSGMLDELNSRLRELEGARRQSVWQSSPPGSVSSSSAGGVHYHSPSAMPPSGLYQQPAMPLQTPAPVLTHAHPSAHSSPPPYVPQSSQQQANGPASFGMVDFSSPVSNYQAQPQPQFQPAMYNFAQAPNIPQHSHRPSTQFANWGGYSGIGGQPDTLDDENAVPPDANPWNIDHQG